MCQASFRNPVKMHKHVGRQGAESPTRLRPRKRHGHPGQPHAFQDRQELRHCRLPTDDKFWLAAPARRTGTKNKLLTSGTWARPCHCPRVFPCVRMCCRPALGNLRRARKGGAVGLLASYTSGCCRLVLDDETASVLFVRAASTLAKARVPPCIAAAFGLGRMVAPQKPNGRVRGIVVGDFLRRLVARSLAQNFANRLLDACRFFFVSAPFSGAAGLVPTPPHWECLQGCW